MAREQKKGLDRIEAARAAGVERREEGLSDEEIARRLDEKIQLQQQLARERGTRTSTPTPAAKVVEVDPEEAEALNAELIQARADLHALGEAEKEARRQEQAILAQADRERQHRRQALIAHTEEIQARVAEVEARARTQRLAELAAERSADAERNAQMVEAGSNARRAELERLFRPILTEIEATMREADDFMRAYGGSLRLLAQQTFSTADASFPIRIRQKLSSEVYRPAERLLADINVVQACGAAGGDPRWDTLLRESITAGTLISPEGQTLTMKYAGAFNRDHVRTWERTLAHLTDRLEKLTAEGKAQAQAPPSIRITISDKHRQEAAREARLGKIDSTRQHTADFGRVLDTPANG